MACADRGRVSPCSKGEDACSACSLLFTSVSEGYRVLSSNALVVMHARKDFPMTSLLTSCCAEVPPSTVYCSDEIVTLHGVAITAVLVLTALGVRVVHQEVLQGRLAQMQ